MSFNSGSSSSNQQNQQQQPIFGAFGQPQQNSFGQSTRPPTFGDASKPTFGAFGSVSQPFGQANLGTTNTNTAQTPFGSTTAPTLFGGFGQQQQQQQQQQPPANVFGQTSTNSFGQTSTNLFGQQASAPFGQTSTSTTNAFGQPPSSFAFGQQPQQLQSQQPSSSSFVFGQQQQPATKTTAPTTTTSSLFGQPSTGGFGQATTTAPAFGQSLTGSNFFGPPQQASTAIPTSTTTTTTTQPSATGLFSSPATAANTSGGAVAPSAGLFGSSISSSMPTTINTNRPTPEQPANPVQSIGIPPSSTTTTNQPGFSFGEGKFATSTTASQPQATNPQQPLLNFASQSKPAEPSKPAFTFGSTTQQPSATLPTIPSSASSSQPALQTSSSLTSIKEDATAKPNTLATFPSALKGKTLEEIVVGWQEELEDQMNCFQKVAIELAAWDKEILANEEAILGLADRVNQVENWEAELEQNLAFIAAQQAELEGLLDLIEKELPAVADAMAPNVMPGGTMTRLSPADAERDRLFDLASSLQSQLNDLSMNLSEMINDSNHLNAQMSKDEDSKTKQVTQIMNEQIQTLAWVDRQLEDLNRTKAYTRKLADKAKQHHKRLFL